MDTRAKIVDAVQARLLANKGATVVSGYFDPLVASHAAVVDYVCETADDVAPHLSLEREHTERLVHLIDHVHIRQRAAS